MLPKLNALNYEVDWVYYSYLEHKIWFQNINNYDNIFESLKQEITYAIKKYLSVLFIEYNVEKFKSVANDFWDIVHKQEEKLEEIYKYLISLHKNI